MTRELLNKIVKAKKINIDWYDSIFCFINEYYTKVFVTFGLSEVCGGRKTYHNKVTVCLSVSAIIKRGEEIPEDYETNGWQYLFEIR